MLNGDESKALRRLEQVAEISGETVEAARENAARQLAGCEVLAERIVSKGGKEECVLKIKVDALQDPTFIAGLLPTGAIMLGSSPLVLVTIEETVEAESEADAKRRLESSARDRASRVKPDVEHGTAIAAAEMGRKVRSLEVLNPPRRGLWGIGRRSGTYRGSLGVDELPVVASLRRNPTIEVRFLPSLRTCIERLLAPVQTFPSGCSAHQQITNEERFCRSLGGKGDAAIALRRYDAPEALSALLSVLETEIRPPEVPNSSRLGIFAMHAFFRTVAWVLGDKSLKGRFTREATGPLLRLHGRGLGNTASADDVKREALKSLLSVDVEWILEHTADDDSKIRATCAEVLSSSTDPRSEGALLRLLTDPDNRFARQHAARGLSERCSNPAVLEALTRAASDPDDDVRRIASKALAGSKSPSGQRLART